MKRTILAIACLLATAAMAQEKNDTVAYSKELEGITVKARHRLVKTAADRISYDVKADEEAKTQTVLDLLRKVPMVTIDGQENILVRGNSQYKIYRNGHADPNLSKNAKEILKAMPAASVKRIEVITDPGAREDAEGTTAILNIVTDERSRLDGITGTANIAYGTLNHPNLSAHITTQTGPLILSADYGYGGMGRRETDNRSSEEKTYSGTGHTLTSQYEGCNPGDVHYADLNASLDIDSLNLLSATFGGYFYQLNVQGQGHTALTAARTAGYSYDSRYRMPDYSHHSWNGRLDYEHKTRRQGERFTLSYMLALTRQHTDQLTEYYNKVGTPFAYDQLLDQTREHFTEHTMQADWLRPLGKGHRIEAGLKYIYRLNSSNAQQTADNMRTTDSRFDHIMQIAAAYTDYLFSHNAWTVRAGLRYEYSHLQGRYPDGSADAFGRHLSDWVPQASVTWQASKKQTLKLSYTTSIRRPGIGYLNPAVMSYPQSISFGNERLGSARTRMVTLSYMYMSERLTLQIAPSYKFTNNSIERLYYATGDVTYTTYGNIGKMHRWQMEAYMQWKPFDTTTLSLNANTWHDHLANTAAGLEQRGQSGFYNVTLGQQLPARLRLTLGVYGQIGHTPDNVYSYSRSWTSY